MGIRGIISNNFIFLNSRKYYHANCMDEPLSFRSRRKYSIERVAIEEKHHVELCIIFEPVLLRVVL